MPYKNLDALLDARREDVTAMTAEEYKTLLDCIGIMTMKQLERCTKEGTADHLRDAAREEIVARAARSGWKSNLGIIIAFISILIAILSWLYPRTPSP